MALRLGGVAAGFRAASEEDQFPPMLLYEGPQAGERAWLDFVQRLPEILAVAHRRPDLALLARRQRPEGHSLILGLAGFGVRSPVSGGRSARRSGVRHGGRIDAWKQTA